MKKLLFIALIVTGLSSCKKDAGTCYYCTFGTINGQNPPPQSYCGEPNRQFRDAAGNSLPSYCVIK